jgi:glutathione S-transferase
MIELYGVALSRAFRCLWMLEELGVPYRHVPVHFRDDSKTQEYLALNPNGRVPCLKDGDLVLFESLAINLYLCRKYGPAFMPDGGLEGEAKAFQWTLWATNELDGHLGALNRQRVHLGPEERDPDAVALAEAALERPMRVLDDALAGREYLVGDRFSVADLNVASVLATAITAQYGFRERENVSAWFGRCFARDAARRVGALARAGR